MASRLRYGSGIVRYNFGGFRVLRSLRLRAPKDPKDFKDPKGPKEFKEKHKKIFVFYFLLLPSWQISTTGCLNLSARRANEESHDTNRQCLRSEAEIIPNNLIRVMPA